MHCWQVRTLHVARAWARSQGTMARIGRAQQEQLQPWTSSSVMIPMHVIIFLVFLLCLPRVTSSQRCIERLGPVSWVDCTTQNIAALWYKCEVPKYEDWPLKGSDMWHVCYWKYICFSLPKTRCEHIKLVPDEKFFSVLFQSRKQ